MTDKNFCLNSYMAYRYICRDDMDFYPGMRHRCFTPVDEAETVKVASADDILTQIGKQVDALYARYRSIGILLSGGMDSAILASFLRPGSHAYTFTTSHSRVFEPDLMRARMYCDKFGLQSHLVDINREDYEQLTPIVMARKCAPVHSIEPQIYKAALQARADGVELLLVGESADLVFGGMDQLLSRDWSLAEFRDRYTFLKPERVLRQFDPRVYDLYENYRLDGDGIDFVRFMDEVFSIESSSSYFNAFGAADMPYYDPYARLRMRDPLDLSRVRGGEPKYLVRDTFARVYPEIPIPSKVPMPRPVDKIFATWSGPTRDEFRDDIDMSALTGNQKWQLWCAQLFLDINEK